MYRNRLHGQRLLNVLNIYKFLIRLSFVWVLILKNPRYYETCITSLLNGFLHFLFIFRSIIYGSCLTYHCVIQTVYLLLDSDTSLVLFPVYKTWLAFFSSSACLQGSMNYTEN